MHAPTALSSPTGSTNSSALSRIQKGKLEEVWRRAARLARDLRASKVAAGNSLGAPRLYTPIIHPWFRGASTCLPHVKNTAPLLGGILWAETLAKSVGWGGAEYTSSAWAHSLRTYSPFWSSTWALTTSTLTIDNFGEQHKCWNGSEALNHWERTSLESIQKLTPSTVHRQCIAGLFSPSKAHTLSVKPHHTERASSRLAWWNAAMVEAAAGEAAMGTVIKSYYNLTQLARQILS